MANIIVISFITNMKGNPSAGYPRFSGSKLRKKDPDSQNLRFGLFGLLDGDQGIGYAFEDTTIEAVLIQKLQYSFQATVRGTPADYQFLPDRSGIKLLPPVVEKDHSLTWLIPFKHVDLTGKEWDVYLVVAGEDVYIAGNDVSFSSGCYEYSVWERIAKGCQNEEQALLIRAATQHAITQGFPPVAAISQFGS